MILNGGKNVVKMCLIKPSEWLALSNKQRAMITRTSCHRPYSTKEKVKKRTRQKEEVVQQTPEVVPVVPEKVTGKSELTKNDEAIQEIIEKSKNEKKMRTNACAAIIEQPKKHLKLSDYLIQNMMDFPLHKPADFDDSIIDEKISELLYNFPSISTILNETKSVQDRITLDRWKKKMISQLGEAEFYNQQADPVKKTQSKRALPKNVKKSKKIISEKFARGSQFHGIIKKYLLGKGVEEHEMNDDVKGCWKSVSSVLNDFSEAKHVESNVYHPFLYYKGCMDCIANYRNEWHVIEWKVVDTARKSLKSTYSAPIQTCAYLGTLSWCKHLDIIEPISKGLIVFALVDGSPAQVFPISPSDSEIYWDQWLKRLQMYWSTRSNRGESVAGDEPNLDKSKNSDFRDA